MRVATDKLSVNSFVKEKSGVKKLLCLLLSFVIAFAKYFTFDFSARETRWGVKWEDFCMALRKVDFKGTKVILRVYFLSNFSIPLSLSSCAASEHGGRFEIQNSIFNLKNFTSNCHIVCMLSTQRHFKWVEHFFTWAQSCIFTIFHRSLHQAHAYIPTSCHLSLVD